MVFPTLVGGFPVDALTIAASAASSPRSWGCFTAAGQLRQGGHVFPTLVGVFPPWITSKRTTPRLPHARGGVSTWATLWPQGRMSSPRSWGCFRDERRDLTREVVFPTLVGVFLNSEPFRPLISGLPHARGGVSSLPSFESSVLGSSPRSWGCFCSLACRCHACAVFPTLVGVFPGQGEVLLPHWRLPHARGGVSKKGPRLVSGVRSSPRSWGCFPCIDHAFIIRSVFPTLVGVFPRQSPAWGTIRSKWELLHVLCPYSKEINANGTLLKRRKKASYRANFLLIVPMLYRFKKYF